MKLEDMGFVMRLANTPEQMARLRLLPSRKFVARTNGGGRYYLYADPDYCQCVFVGSENAMKNYQALNAPSSAPPWRSVRTVALWRGRLFRKLIRLSTS